MKRDVKSTLAWALVINGRIAIWSISDTKRYVRENHVGLRFANGEKIVKVRIEPA